MAEPLHVANCINALKNSVKIPVTAKTRIGIDHQDSYEFFSSFAHTLIEAGCDKLIVHARKAWLKGLSPKQNRTIPPVNYDYVYQLKKEYPDTQIILNGNVLNLDEIHHHLTHIDGVMLGRLAYQNPYALAVIHQGLYPTTTLPSRLELLTRYIDYLYTLDLTPIPFSLLIKPVLNMAHGIPDAHVWKKALLEAQKMKQVEKIEEALVVF
jgi:tRNA-dihydrouridine synthase A